MSIPSSACFRRNGRGRDGEYRGGEVHRDPHLVGNASSGDVTGPADDRRHAYAAFPHCPLLWKNGALRDSHSPPLSFVKITIVFRVSRDCRAHA